MTVQTQERQRGGGPLTRFIEAVREARSEYLERRLGKAAAWDETMAALREMDRQMPAERREPTNVR